MNPGAIICQQATWDYATAGYVISSLPREIRCVLNATQLHVLQTVLYLTGLHARKGGRQSLYAVPSQRYLGECVGKTDRTIRRAISRLVSLSLLCSRRRFTPSCDPQTNLYQLGGQLLALLHNIKWPKSLRKSQQDKNVLQRPKEKVRTPTAKQSEVLDGMRGCHKPADLASLPVPGGGDRLEESKFRAGIESIKAAITAKLRQ